jgi:hypothetical protein
MPPFDSIELSGHVPIRGEQRGYTVEQARTCIQNPGHIEKTQGRGGIGFSNFGSDFPQKMMSARPLKNCPK